MRPLKGPIRVLVVDDMIIGRDILVDIFETVSDIVVVGTASDGVQALVLARSLHPDVITMDIDMPSMNGLEATRRIMETIPIPVIILGSANDGEESADVFHGREAGATAVCQKPDSREHPLFEAQARRIIHVVRVAAEVQVFRRWKQHPIVLSGASHNNSRLSIQMQPKILAVGASTGGPPVLCEILTGLTKFFPLPVLIVQHIAPGFLGSMATWLASTSGFPVEIAKNGNFALPGHAYLAPDATHMSISVSGIVSLQPGPAINSMCPSISVLFKSVAREFGSAAVGMLLTGMGKDGAKELLQIRQAHGLTIAQDQETSVVFGMPGEAIRLDAADYVLPPNRIVELLLRYVA
jgi:two-component system chemotaxis response regulator CheB